MEDVMQVSKWGNSLAVRLPKKLVEDMALSAGDELKVVEVEDRTIVVEKVDRKAEFLREIEKFRWELPADYKFDREEANER
ncbi:AbrB/MazE/SpoVT family DNA-binding domain-containing protein [Pararhizobium gei]|uniref:AbrB/MazE/SpoVT family DNA-binding domain-containing protein n=1 Tax=Pararhizobium gei TaxID=1395951 RepID=UPI0030842DF1